MLNQKTSRSNSSIPDNKKNTGKIFLKNPAFVLSLGMKLLIGVGLISNLCIGILVFVNWQANKEITHKIEEVTVLRDNLARNLRQEIVGLQDKYLEIPRYLEVDPTKDIFKWIEKNYPGKEDQVIEGRSNYKSFFSRTQRRDIALGCFVPHIVEGTLMLSRGMMDENGSFTGAVHMMRLPSDDYKKDMEKVISMIENFSKSDSADKLKQNIASLTGMLADEAISSEKIRNQIVQFVEEIAHEDQELKVFREQKESLGVYIAGATIILNLTVLYLLTWFIVEKPLRKLYMVINRIQEGKAALVPFQLRRDKIGVLARTVQNFKSALDELKKEDCRKQEERKIIQGLISLMTEMIHGLQSRAREMAGAASSLHNLALRTETRSSKVNESATQTASNTDEVSEAAGRLKTAVENIGTQIETQNHLMEKMIKVTDHSQMDMEALGEASRDIVSITKIVKDISGKTKLLALNANIEAARSGSAGNGFAVVAREIKDLSDQTQAATAEISNKIMSIQQASQNVIESIINIEDRIEHLSQASHHINASVDEQKQATGDIARNVDLTSRETLEVSLSIQEVQEAAGHTREFSSQVQEHTQSISKALDTLLDEAVEKLAAIGIEVETFASVSPEEKKEPGGKSDKAAQLPGEYDMARAA